MVPEPTGPPVRVVRLDAHLGPPSVTGPHTHDFLALTYFESDGGVLRGTAGPRRIRAGDLYVVAPGDVMDLVEHRAADGWGLFFTLDALGPDRPPALLSWRTHPLLFPFVRGAGPGPGTSPHGALRLRVPVELRAGWSDGVAAIATELARRRDGYRQAVLAHLVLRLVEVARLAGDVSEHFSRGGEPVLAEVFAVIERRYAEPLSLAGVARAVALTPGHLTTTVRRRTGRTVQEWITERRMAEARRLLVETGLPVGEVGRLAGYPDPGYFARAFRREHGASPREWRGG